MAGTGYKGSKDLLVDSSYLYDNLKGLNEKREKKLHDSLFIDHETVIEHYVLTDVQDGSKGLLIVDTVVSNPDTEVLLADVQAKLLPDESHNFVAGEYVELIAEVPAYQEEIYLRKSTLSTESDLLDLDTFDEVAP